MFEELLKAKNEHISNLSHQENSLNFDKFSKEFSKFKQEQRAIEAKPNKEQLFGRPFKI